MPRQTIMNTMGMRHRFMFLFPRIIKLRTHASLPWLCPFAYGGPKTSTLTSRVRSAARHRFCPTLRACASGQRTSYLKVSSPATDSERRLRAVGCVLAQGGVPGSEDNSLGALRLEEALLP